MDDFIKEATSIGITPWYVTMVHKLLYKYKKLGMDRTRAINYWQLFEKCEMYPDFADVYIEQELFKHGILLDRKDVDYLKSVHVETI